VKKKSKCITIMELLAQFLDRFISFSDISSMLAAKGKRNQAMLKPIEAAIAALGDNSDVISLFDEVLKKVLTQPLLLKEEVKECVKGGYSDPHAMQLLLTAVSILSGQTHAMTEPLFTDISPVPFIRQPFSRSLFFPLADRIEVSFVSGSSLPHNTMLTVHGDPGTPHDTRVFYSSTKQWEAFTFKGGHLHISFSLYVSEEENETMGDLDLSSQYSLHVRPIYNKCFKKQGWDYFQQVGLEDCFSLIVAGLESPNEITTTHASSALANFLFYPRGEEQISESVVSSNYFSAALKRLLLLFKDDLSARSIFHLRNTGNVPITLCNNLYIKPTAIKDFKARRNIFFEVTCSQNTAKIGYVIPLEHRVRSEYLPTSLKSASVFGAEISHHSFYLDLTTKELVWGTQKTRVDIPHIHNGDVIGVQLDVQSFKMIFYLNGEAIVDDACFDAATHGGPDLWTCGFQPAIWLDKGVHAPFIFNFGQSKFVFPPKINFRCYSLLELIRNTPCPLKKKDQVSWQSNVWSIHDGSTACGFRPVHDDDCVFIKKGDAYVTEKRHKINFRRQIARGLCGASPLEEDGIAVAVELAKCNDIFTRNWAVKCLLNTINEGKHHQLIMDDPTVLLLVLKTCTETSRPQFHLFFSDALDNFHNKNTVFELMQQYVFANTAPSDTMLVESEHPYSAGRNNYPAEEIHFPEAASMEIVFDPSTRTERNGDYVCFYSVDPKGLDDSRRAFYRIGRRYSGTDPAAWPSLWNPLRIPYNRVWVTFSTDDHVQYWGYRFIATGKSTDMFSPFSVLTQNSKMQEFESSHPYMKDSDVTSRINLPGNSSFFKITFDAKSHLNASPNGNTSITFYRRNPKLRGEVKYPISFKYTGMAFPGVNGMDPLIIELDNEATDIDYNRNNRTIWFHFEADDCAVGWGWRFVITPCDAPVDPLQHILEAHPEGMVVETNHPCLQIDRTATATMQKEYLCRRDVHYPGAESIAIVFDPRSETRLDSTHRPDMTVMDENNASSFLEMVLLVNCFLAGDDNDSSPQTKGILCSSQRLDGKSDKSPKKFSLEELATMSKWVIGTTWMYGGGLGGKAGLMTANFPTSPSKPLIVPANRFFFTFASVYHNDCVQWGVRCFTYPLYNRPQRSLTFDRLAALEGAVVLNDETAHVGKDGRVRIKIPDTQLVQICFDQEETGCFNEDRGFMVKVFSGRPPKRVRTAMEDSKRVGAFSCTSGRRYFPGVDGYPPLVLNKPNLWLDVIQPNENGYKGSYTLVVAPYQDELVDWIGSDGEIIDVVHPYVTPSKKAFLYESRHENQWMEIAFDRRTSLGPGASVAFSSRHASMSEFMVLSGTQMEGQFPTTDRPARIASSACVITFVSTFEATMTSYWGYRVAIRPVPALEPTDTDRKHLSVYPLEKSLFDITYRSIEYQHMKLTIQSTIFELLYLLTRGNEASKATRYVETERMEGIYLPDVDMEGSVTFPLAQKLEVTFSPRTHTETDSDVLNLYGAKSMRDENYLKYYNEAKRDESIATFSGPFHRIGHWADMQVSQDRLFYSFSSETVHEPMWGFKMCVSPIYSAISTPSTGFLDDLVRDRTIFGRLESKLHCKESAAVGLVLSNILLSEKTRAECVSLYGVKWFHNLLLLGSDDVIIVTLNSLLSKQEPYSPSQSGLEFIDQNQCVPTLIKLLGHDNTEIKEISLMFLNSLFSPSPSNDSSKLSVETPESPDRYCTESVLLNIVASTNIDELRLASEILSKLLHTNVLDPGTMKGSSSEEAFGERLMRKLKNIFVDPSKVESRLEVALTLCTLMATENGISDFLGRSNSGDNYSTECLSEVLHMLASAVTEKKRKKTNICLQFLKNLCHKSTFKTDTHRFFRMSNGCVSLLPHSFQVKQVMRPLWLDLSAPVEPDTTTTTSSSSSSGGRSVVASPLASSSSKRGGGGFSSKFKNSTMKKTDASSSSDEDVGCGFMVGFWVRSSGFLDRDGLPIFYRGEFSGVLTPPRCRTSFRVANNVRHSRVYYEVTLNSFSQTGKDCTVRELLFMIVVNNNIIVAVYVC
jgi:hypothetical protein